MSVQINQIIDALLVGQILPWIYAILLFVVGLIAAKFAGKIMAKLVTKYRGSPHQVMIIHKLTYIIILAIFITAALQQIGFKLTALLGAAGLLTVAIGLAAKSAVSNLTSGLFLILEQPFKVGDTINVGNITGTVKTVDLLSVKISTADNTLVRIPNETMIQATVINYSYYPQRRLNLIIAVGYETNLKEAKRILFEVTKANEYCLTEPAPQIMVEKLGESAIQLEVLVWVKTENYWNLKSNLQEQITRAFRERNIDVPYPQQTVHLIQE